MLRLPSHAHHHPRPAPRPRLPCVQAFLGLTFNWGALFGWAAARGACDWAVVLPLYASGVCWTLVYDTIYAHQVRRWVPPACKPINGWARARSARSLMPIQQLLLRLVGASGFLGFKWRAASALQDKHDDVKAGIRSTALTFGTRTKAFCAGFGAASVALLAATGQAAGCGPAYYAGELELGGVRCCRCLGVSAVGGLVCLGKRRQAVGSMESLCRKSLQPSHPAHLAAAQLRNIWQPAPSIWLPPATCHGVQGWLPVPRTWPGRLVAWTWTTQPTATPSL